MSPTRLSLNDVSRLLRESSVESKADTAVKLAAEMERGNLSPQERALAEDIFRLMARDAELAVRSALAENEMCRSVLPRDVALLLSKDIDSVVLPILEHSSSLTDEDLITIIASETPAKQLAIARRSNLGAAVSDALIDTRNADVVVNLMANETARISEPGLQKVVDEFGTKSDVQRALVLRSQLPSTVVERLVTTVSERLRRELAEHHNLSPETVTSLIAASRERATITLTAGIDRDDAAQLVEHMHAHNRLTPGIILRSICMGDIPFFEAAMALRGGVSLENAVPLIYDPGGNGFAALYKQAKMPEVMFRAFTCALAVSGDSDFDGGEMDRERHCQRTIERILTQYEEFGIRFDSADLDYLLTKMDQLQEEMDSSDGSSHPDHAQNEETF
ncbi:hypothetical protein FACS1894205_3700 [Alphaproteobacteria bacterium]|nr:hypothetical protein FACS1894205_3700 [Alphaproteobacteria bacterium]